MRLWLVRHARPQVEEGLCYGALDVAADEDETEAAARRLARVLPHAVRVLNSPLRRCTQLAQALTVLRPDLVPGADPRLAEMDFGSWEGRRWDDIDRAELAAWTGDFAQYCAGGNGECVSSFVARVDQVLEEARAAGEDQAWIAHGGVFKAVWLRHRAIHLAGASDWPRQGLDCGEWHQFDLEA